MQKSQYGNNIAALLYNILDEYGLCELITDYAADPVKLYLSDKYNEYYFHGRHISSLKHKFSFDEVSDYFTHIELVTGARHNLIDIRKRDSLIYLYYNDNNIPHNVVFKLKPDGLYLQPEHPSSVSWPYNDAPTMLQLYLNKIFRDNYAPNSSLICSDILFRHC
jgi:hypothetical protein